MQHAWEMRNACSILVVKPGGDYDLANVGRGGSSVLQCMSSERVHWIELAHDGTLEIGVVKHAACYKRNCLAPEDKFSSVELASRRLAECRR
jgi:hypothetical protein